MKYRIDDKIRYIGLSYFGTITYGEVYVVKNLDKKRVHIYGDNGGLVSVYEHNFEPAKLGEKKMNNELDNGDKLVLMKMVLKEFSELQNSLSELAGQQKKDCLVSMMRMNELLEKLGE